MYGDEIEQYVKSDELLCSMFNGIFNIYERLPIYVSYPSFYIFNIGRHWVTVVVNSCRHGEYFDSFGLPPPQRIHLLLDNICTSWEYNQVRVQSMYSTYCGHYCLLFLKHRLYNFDSSDFINMFNQLDENEKSRTVCSLFMNSFSSSTIKQVQETKERMFLYKCKLNKRIDWQ